MSRRLHTTLRLRCLENRIAPATFTVMNLNDSGADSLRDCVAKANAASGADTIAFKAGLSGTITLTTGELVVSGGTVGTVTITGPGATTLTVSGNNASRIFNIDPASFFTTVAISGLTLTGGKAVSGGAIFGGDEQLQLTNCVLSNNSATTGGAVMIGGGGTLTATTCSFINNQGGANGGAIFVVNSTARTVLRSCIVSGNQAPVAGGVYATNYLIVENCTIASNTATTQQGGGIWAVGSFSVGNLEVRNTTISNNRATTDGAGIGLFNSFAILDVQNCTITGNSAGKNGGGIARVSGPGSISIESSVVSGNTSASAPDVFSTGTVNQKTSAVGSGDGFTKTDLGGNLPFQPHTALHLSSLALNGGPTLTYSLGATSPLRDAGSNPASLTTDQRGTGFPRVVGSQPDIGAFEAPPPTALVVTNTADSGPGSLRQIVQDANAAPGPDLINFDPVVFASPQTISLTNGEIPINDTLAIVGPTAKVTVDGKSLSRLFSTKGAIPASDVVLQNMVLTNGNLASDIGAAIFVAHEALTLQNCVVTNCTATTAGAIDIDSSIGSLLIEDSTLSGNTTGGSGGAIVMAGSGPLTILRSTLNNNVANSSRGGALGVSSLSGNVLIEDTTFSTNASYHDGGAIYANTSGTVTIRRCTLSGNSSEFNGGAFALAGNGSATIEDCKFTDNFGYDAGAAISGGKNTTLIIRRTTLTGNSTSLFGAASGGGGAIKGATLVIEDSTLSGNSAARAGGAVFATGYLTIRRSTLNGNIANAGGAIFANKMLIEDTTMSGNNAGIAGAIYVVSSQSILTLRRSTLSGNTSFVNGGAIYEYSDTFETSNWTLEFSTLSGNTANATNANEGGGAIYFYGGSSSTGTFLFRDCTFSGNAAPGGSGGAICLRYFYGSATIQNCTIVSNSVGNNGGGIARINGTGTLSLSSTIVAGNTSAFGPDIVTFAGPNVSGNNNLIGVANEGFVLTGAGNLTGTKLTPLNAKLGPLANNGGPTFTHMPLAGSPALNAGNNAAGLTTDQRGSARVVGTAADIGAFELQTSTKVASVVVNDGSAQRSRVTSLKVTFDQPPFFAGSPSAAFQLKRQSDNAAVVVSAAATGVVVTLTFTGGAVDFGSLADGRYTLTASASQITNLDGDSNGTVGGDFVLIGNPATNKLFRLYGDADGNGIVDGLDFGAFRTAFNTNSSVFDFDASGVVDGVDFGQFRQRFGVVI